MSEIDDLKHELELLKKQLQIAELNAEIERKKREKAEAQASARSPYPWVQPKWTSSGGMYSSTYTTQEPITVHGEVKTMLEKLDEAYRSLNKREYKGKHEA